MNFYNYIFATSLIFILLHNSVSDRNIELVYPDSGIITPSPVSIGLVFFITVNNTSDRNDYDVEITPDECCLRDEDYLDCESLQILGGCTDFVPKGKTKKLTVVAPLLNQYERAGHCTIYVHSKSNKGQNKRDTIKINFDTKLSKNNIYFGDHFNHCDHKDEDLLNDCRPVNCDTYYNGKKPYFNKIVRRCVEVPSCVTDDGLNYPNIIYNPFSNQCSEESIVKEDLDYIKTFSRDTMKKRKTKDVLIINKFRPNTTDFAVKDVLIDDIETTTNSNLKNTKYIKVAALNLKPTAELYYKKTDCFKVFLKKYFIDNKWTLMVLVLVVTVQCFLICTMVYCLSKTCNCCEDKKVIRKFFNYRHDVSVTTPLIGTSNVDTETADCQYLTESSNVDQKIKCYKACQKEENNNIKKSMSDDILSKCINRRDWKKFKSEAITEPENNTEVEKNVLNETQFKDVAKNKEMRVHNETKVMFEDETINMIDNKMSKREAGENILNENGNPEFGTSLSSEKEIKCHSYNRFDTGVTDFRANLANSTGIFKGGKCKKISTSHSTEKGAQAYFSNDSIDDFLSERGVIYLAGENMSKYTFSNGSNDMKPSMTSSVSSRTSKNFVKNVLSLLHKRSKQGPSSDPGQNKDTDVELIHMSRASVYSSTNDSDCIKTFIKKDSRISF